MDFNLIAVVSTLTVPLALFVGHALGRAYQRSHHRAEAMHRWKDTYATVTNIEKFTFVVDPWLTEGDTINYHSKLWIVAEQCPELPDFYGIIRVSDDETREIDRPEFTDDN